MADDRDDDRAGTGDEVGASAESGRPATADGDDGGVEEAAAGDEMTAAEETDIDTDGGVARPRPRTGWERLSETFLRPATPPRPRAGPATIDVDYASMTDDEKRARITQIDPMERKVGLGASALAAVFALVYTIPYMVAKISVATPTKPKDQHCLPHFHYVAATKTCNTVYPANHYAFSLILWLVFAVAIYVTVRIGRRAPMAFAIVLTGLAFGTVIIMLPYVVCGAWLLLRAYRTQKYGAPTAKAPVEGYVRPPPRSGRGPGRAATSGGTRNTTRRRRGNEPEPEPAVRRPPTASKRYTPKSAPKRKVPPPS